MQSKLEEGLQQLCDHRDLVIIPADKRGVVVLDKEAYVGEITKILNDRDTYIPLRRDLGLEFQKELTKIVNRGFQQDIINQKLFLVPSFPRLLCAIF